MHDKHNTTRGEKRGSRGIRASQETDLTASLLLDTFYRHTKKAKRSNAFLVCAMCPDGSVFWDPLPNAPPLTPPDPETMLGHLH